MKRITMILILPSLFVVLLFVNNCAKQEGAKAVPTAVGPLLPGDGIIEVIPDSASTFSLQTNRVSGSKNVRLLVTLASSVSATVADIKIEIPGGTVSAITDEGSKKFSAVFVPNKTSFVYEAIITVRGESMRRELLVFKNIDEYWDQPESVTGLVNTFGWEDSPEVSPDGEWLIVTTYSPVSLICCILGSRLNTSFGINICENAGNDGKPDSVACNYSRGKYNDNYRPNMLGAERILSVSQINHAVAAVNMPGNVSANPPVAAYGFKRQSDGRFAEPFVIGMDWEGNTWGAPFGATFVPGGSGTTRQILFAFGDPLESTGVDVYQYNLNLGATNIMGLYRYDSGLGQVVRSNFQPTKVSMTDLSGQQGNPFFDGTYLYFDDEARTAKDLFFTTKVSDPMVFGATQRLGISQSGRDEYQPYWYGDRLYYSAAHTSIVSNRYISGPRENASSWDVDKVELEVDPTAARDVGGLSVIGEPSIAVDSSGKRWLYFAYSTRRSFGLDLNIGRVPAR